MRYPAVAGTYYPSDKTELKAEIDKLLTAADAESAADPLKGIGAIVVPHGQLIECGDVMAAAYARLRGVQEFTTFVVVGTDHFGKGRPIAISREDWRTPFGIVKNDRELADAIGREAVFADFDEKAHNFEPACEVQLPFIQAAVGGVRCVEISVASHTFDIAKDLANAIDKAAISAGRDIILVCSTDFSNDVAPDRSEKEDSDIFDYVEKMNAKGMMDEIESIGSSICGPAVLGTAMIYAEMAGISPRLLKRKPLPTGKKDSVKSFVSIAFGKTG